MTDVKDIINSRQLGKGFIIFQTDSGYFIGFLLNGEIQVTKQIDKSAYNTIEKSSRGTP